MQNVLKKIEQLEKQLSNISPIKPEYKAELDKKIRLEFSYNSNHIEGNTLTYGETKLLLFFDKTTGNHDLREYEEMKAHDVAFEIIKDLANDSKRLFTESDLKNLHQILLVRPFWKEAQTADGHDTRRLIEVGKYKKFPNSVRLQNGEMFNYTSPIDTPILMHELFEWYRNEEAKNEIHPVALAALLHYKFVCIHPFDDGNGRISRLLMNYVLTKHNLPPVIIKTSDKKNYLFALNQADAGDINAFVKYIAEQLIWSLELYIKAAKGESIEEPADLEKEISVWKKNTFEGRLKKNREIVLKIFRNLINDSFKKFEAEHKILFELFYKHSKDYFLNDYKFYDPNQIYDKISENNLKYLIVIDDEDLGFANFNPKKKYKQVEIETKKYSNTCNNIWMKISLLEYSGVPNFSLISSLKFDLDNDEYRVSHNNINLIKKNYDQFLTNEEIAQIVKTCVKNVFEEIKEKSKN